MSKNHKKDCLCCSCRSARGECCSSSPATESLRKEKIRRAVTGRNLGRSVEDQGHKVDCSCGVCQAKRGRNPNKLPEVRQKHKQTQTRLWKDKEYRDKLRSSHIEYENQPEVKAKKSVEHRRRWKDPLFVQKQMAARNVVQNKSEKFLESLILQFDFSFVGDGEKIIAGKCPDFINEENHLIIELFGDYWHEPEEVEPRVKMFESQGYQTLVIWEHELKEPEQVLRKVEEFIQRWTSG